MANQRRDSPEHSAKEFLPARRTLRALRQAAARCRGCELYRHAKQTVFGRGPGHAELMFVGEQPGDYEDQLGEPFVGPAGRLLDEQLEKLGIDRAHVYVTNAVKHFKWEPRGKRRLHAKPSAREISACYPWLEAEIDIVAPRLVICLGATASGAVLGREFRLTRQHGTIVQTQGGLNAMATYHPSAVLRAPGERRKALLAMFSGDLIAAKNWLARQVRAVH